MDRKALIRQYKETPRPMGVFRVHNTVDDKSFVGISRDLPSMLNRQRFQLEHGSHPNRALQEDWNRPGSDAFVIEVLDTLSPSQRPDSDPSDDLRVLEQLWLEKLSPFGERGYNGERPPASKRGAPELWAGPHARVLADRGGGFHRRIEGADAMSHRTSHEPGAGCR